MTDRTRDTSGFVLGTAQLRDAYGIAHAGARPTEDDAAALLDAAAAAGVTAFDTSPVYSNSEEILGRWLAAARVTATVTTKFHPAVDMSSPAEVRASAEASTQRLCRPPDAILIHDPSWLARWHAGVDAALRAIGDAGVPAVGISVYTPEEFDRALRIEGITTVQAPASAFDRRLLDGGALARAADAGVSVQLRSVFLQGVLLMEPATLQMRLPEAADAARRWRTLCTAHALSPEETALRFVRAAAPEAAVIVGCDGPEQLKANLRAWRMGALPAAIEDEVRALPALPERVLDPRTWPQEAAPA